MTYTPPVPDFLKPSPFETAFLGGPVFWLSEPERATEATAYGKSVNAALIACRTDLSLARAGFRKIETLVTFEASNSDVPDLLLPRGVEIRRAGPRDVLACQAIATSVLRHNRFHADSSIDDHTADALRAAWIENDIRGRADRVLLACRKDDIVGFNAVLERDGVTVIDLIAVSSKVQGQGIGKALVAAAKTSQGTGTLRVGSQAANTRSIAFYNSLGFQEVERRDTWHWGR